MVVFMIGSYLPVIHSRSGSDLCFPAYRWRRKGCATRAVSSRRRHIAPSDAEGSPLFRK